MSIQSMTSRDTCTIERKSVTRGATGSLVETWNTTNRGALPAASQQCRIQAIPPQEKIEYGMRADRKAWRLYFHFDPHVTMQDRVTFTDSSSTAHTAYPFETDFEWDNQNRLWRIVVEEREAET